MRVWIRHFKSGFQRNHVSKYFPKGEMAVQNLHDNSYAIFA